MGQIITNEKLSQNLKVARVAKGLTQEQVADYLEVSRNTFNVWENNPYTIDFGVLVKLADYFQLDVRTFFAE